MSKVYFGQTGHINGVKIGETECLGSRKTQLNTSYSQHSFRYLDVFAVVEGNAKQLEGFLHKSLERFHISGEAGVEWFQEEALREARTIIARLVETTRIAGYWMTPQEIEEDIKQYEATIEKPDTSTIWETFNQFTLREYQMDVEKEAIEAFTTRKNLTINCACGLGKTLTALSISSHFCEGGRLLVGVPNNYLLGQWMHQFNRLGLYLGKPVLVVSSSSLSRSNTLTTTSADAINEWLRVNTQGIVIVTYQSSHLIRETGTSFAFGIMDECHHLCNSTTNKSVHKNTDILDVVCEKRLFLTATRKRLTGSVLVDNYCESVFGPVLSELSVQWAIENGHITEYYLLTLNMHIDQLEEVMSACGLGEEVRQCLERELFLAAYMALRSIQECSDNSHLLVYTNNTRNAEQVSSHIERLLKKGIFPDIDIDNLYSRALHSNSTEKDSTRKVDLEGEITKFTSAKYGIIPCCHIFSEGFDLPRLTGVVVAENMDSEIRIVQSLTRPHRKDSNHPDKWAYIIAPTIDEDEWLPERRSFKKVLRIVEELRLVDRNVMQRIRAPVQRNRKPGEPMVPIPFRECDTDNALLDKIRLRLRKSTDLSRLRVETLVAHLGRCDIHTFEAYQAHCRANQDLGFPANPYLRFGKEFSWESTYLGETPYYSSEEWTDAVMCLEEMNKIEAVDDHDTLLHNLCSQDPRIPPMYPWEYYGGGEPGEWLMFGS